MPAPTGSLRTLQLHVTRRCNLRCLHCYSSSGPEARETLDPAALKALLQDARALGYNFVTLSGGEPFLYAPMAEVLAHARALDLRTGVVTNGMYLDEKRLAALQGVLDLLVVSLDGAPHRHNAMRANPRAFDTMADRLGTLRASGIPFGFLFTLSRDNVGEIDWAADFAADAGAAMLQIHPLDVSGRAAGDPAMHAAKPDEDAAMAAARAAARAQARLRGRLRLVVDYAPRMPDDAAPACAAAPGFADIANPLCVETDGALVPTGHGFSRRFMLGRLGERPLRDMAADWMVDGRAAAYRALIARTRAAAMDATAPALTNLAQACRHASNEPAPA